MEGYLRSEAVLLWVLSFLLPQCLVGVRPGLLEPRCQILAEDVLNLGHDTNTGGQGVPRLMHISSIASSKYEMSYFTCTTRLIQMPSARGCTCRPMSNK